MLIHGCGAGLELCTSRSSAPNYLMEIMIDQIWKREWKGQTSHQGFYTCSFTKLYKWILAGLPPPIN